MITVLRLAEQLMSVNYRKILLSRLTSSSDQLLQHPAPKTKPPLSSWFEKQDERAWYLHSESIVDMIYRSTETNQTSSSNVYKLQYPYQDASFSTMSHHLECCIPVSQIASSRVDVCGIKITPRDNLQKSSGISYIQENSTSSSQSPQGSTSNQEGLIDEHEIVQEVLQKLKATKDSLVRISGASQFEELWQQGRRTATWQLWYESLQYQDCNYVGQTSSIPPVKSTPPVCNSHGQTSSIPPVTPTLQPVCNHAEQISSIPPVKSTPPVCNSHGQTSSIPPVTPTLQPVCKHAKQISSIPPVTPTPPVCNSHGQTSTTPPVKPALQSVCNQAEQIYCIPSVTTTLQPVSNHQVEHTSSISPVTPNALVFNSKRQTSSDSLHSEIQHQSLVIPNPNDIKISSSLPSAGSKSPQNVMATLSPDQQGKVQQGKTFNGVMQRINFMMAQPLNRSGSQQPLWLQALNAQQSVPRALQPGNPPTPTTPTQPMLPASPIHVNKKRQMTDCMTPPEINAKNQKKESLRPAVAQSTTAPGPPNTMPADQLPSESSFIPILLENELEDVLSQGYPVCLGNGAHGEVHLKRKIVDGTLVAVKRLKGVQDHMKAYHEMITKIRTMMAVQHLTEFNRVLGIIDQQSFGVEFVGDPVSMTSTHLHSVLTNPPANLETADWIQICLDLSRGLLALHNAGWSHNDLHSCNVIIWRDVYRCHKWSAKIIDLGLATRLDPPPPALIYDSRYMTPCYDNCPQMPPEVIEGVCHHSIQTDIYSLGHLFSIITAKKAEMAFVNDIGEICLGLSQSRPSLQSIIQDVERFQTESMQKIAQNNAARG